VAFLFTDVEGSTRRWEADADGMRAALAAHDEVPRSAIEAHGQANGRSAATPICCRGKSHPSMVPAARV
jgi:class 3 adenylate cyclase